MSILVYVENTEGKFKKSAFEVLSYGAALAGKIASLLGDKGGDKGGSEKPEVVALVIGDVEQSQLAGLGRYGAQRVLHVKNAEFKTFVNQAYGSLVAAVAQGENADTVLLSNTFAARSLAGRIAVKLEAVLGTAAVDLPEPWPGKWTIRRAAFSGKAWATEELIGSRRVITVVPNSFPVTDSGHDAPVTDYTYQIPPQDLSTMVLDIIRNTEKISLPDAERVVSAGRGLKGPENWKMIEDLAGALGAATACSKPVSDAGWRPHSEHVGQTGITISPNLYVAVGISGAIQHLAGVSSSKVIVVINKDAEAPFFKVADYGIVGDAFEVIPQLIEAALKLQS